MGRMLGLLALVVGVAVAAGAALGLRALAGVEARMQTLDLRDLTTAGAQDCFWIGPVTGTTLNLAFPDSGALYWPAVFRTPLAPGDHLEIAGYFPQARYLSLHSYLTGGVPYDRLSDSDLSPDPGQVNPFVTAPWRPGQGYTLRVTGGAPPAIRPPNTLYLGPPGQGDPAPLILRLYAPEGTETGADLPRVTLVRATGERLTGTAMCAALDSARPGTEFRRIETPMIAPRAYLDLLDRRGTQPVGGDWALFWNPRLSVLRLAAPTLARAAGFAARLGLLPRVWAYYANLDMNYVSTMIDARQGALVVLEGQLPRTPARGAGAATEPGIDLRYWSLCTNEGLSSTRFVDCLLDGQVPVRDLPGQPRHYRIVVSRADDRPANARADCGVGWLDWGARGDGAGNPHLGLLILRNLLPDAGFAQAIQRIPYPGAERATMGPYLPTLTYTTRAAFEQRGC